MRLAKRKTAGAEPDFFGLKEPWRPPARRGLGAPEVLVCLAAVAIVVLLIVAGLPRQREYARLAACQDNLRRIGNGLALYSNAAGYWPRVPALPAPNAAPELTPLGAMLEELGQSDLSRLTDSEKAPPRQTNRPRGERRVPGFTCPSDLLATGTLWPAPVSYRAVTGDDPGGTNGVFAPGHSVTSAQVQDADGLSYTAAFTERLVGNGSPQSHVRNYVRVPGPASVSECARVAVPGASWHGDAGHTWVAIDWVSTLANHAIRPGASPSCVAADGRTALMSASSGHAGNVHVLMCDGSLRPVALAVDARVWRVLANWNDIGHQRAPGPLPAKGPSDGAPESERPAQPRP